MEQLDKIWTDYAMSLLMDIRPNLPTTKLSTENLSGPSMIRAEVEYDMKVAKLQMK